MSSTSPPSSALPEAPWKAQFHAHISKLSSPSFVLSTLAPSSSSSSSSSSTTSYAPRARFVIFRGFWGELPENKHNTAERNAPVYASEMPCITTDARMEKVRELFETGPGQAAREEQMRGSGGGGPVEAAWWVEEAGTQWRMKGNAYVLCKDDIEDGNSGSRTVKSEIGRRMRVVGEEDKQQGEWSWEREIMGHFGNNSPAIRGSFTNPPPGAPKSAPYDYQNLSLGTKVNSLDDASAATALQNFRVLVIRPDEVEQTDLSNPDKAQRWVYTWRGEGSEGEGVGEVKAGWEVSERWP